MKALWTIFVVYCLVAVGVVIVKHYQFDRDIDCWIDRAQVAAGREDMLKYIQNLKQNLEKRGMTKGHTALIFKNPRNDMSLHYEAINNWIKRLESIKDTPINEVLYQTTLYDLRGAIREIPNPAAGWVWVHYDWWLLLIGIGLLIVSLVGSYQGRCY